MSNDLLLFLAVLPGEEIQAEVTAFKEYAHTHFGSGHALKSPPHVTLFPPFRWARARLPELKTTLSDFAARGDPFFLKLRNFACFRPRVIFVDLEDSEDLRSLQSALTAELAEKLKLETDRRRNFHPHMTIAFKDLKRAVFPRAWAYFSQQEYQRVFEVSHLYLLRHNDRRWEVDTAFQLGRRHGSEC